MTGGTKKSTQSIHGINMQLIKFFLALLLLASDEQKRSQRKLEKLHIYTMLALVGVFGPIDQMEHSSK